jgi:hypothetical protein
VDHKQIYPTVIKHKIIGYFRYVDDTLIIYDRRKTNLKPYETLTDFNEQQPTIKFTIENKLIPLTFSNFSTPQGKREFAIYRKPTQTYIVIPHDSCHPHKHKVSITQ